MLGMQTDIFTFIKILAEYDFSFIEVRMEKPHWDYDNLDEIKKIQDLLNEISVKVISFHAPMWACISNPDNFERVKSLREIEKAILISERFNSKNVVIHADGYSDCSLSLKLQTIRKSMDELVDFARGYDIRILIENLFSPRITSEPEQILSIIDSYSENEAGICLDLGHLNIQGIKFNSLNENYYKRLCSVHLNDNINGEKDEHLLPGMGNTPGQTKEDILDFIDKGINVILETGLLKKINSKKTTNISEYIDSALRICKEWRDKFFI